VLEAVVVPVQRRPAQPLWSHLVLHAVAIPRVGLLPPVVSSPSETPTLVTVPVQSIPAQPL
jgi:hypothetical protein